MYDMRKVFEEISNLADGIAYGESEANALEILRICARALEEPLRNCDVGAAEEQMKRQHDTIKPNIWGKEKIDNSLLPSDFVGTMPELAKAACVSPYGGVTGRPRVLKGWIRLPDGRRFYLGKIAVKFDGWGDGILTEVDMRIRANECEETEDEV